MNKITKSFFNNTLVLVLLLLPSLPLSAQTYSFNTTISTASVPNASISSILDANHNTHIAWVEVTASGEQVMYGKYTSTGVFTSTMVSDVFYRVGSVSIMTDDANNPHITYIIKRDENPEYTFTRTGNYAVYYAGSSDGGSSFTQEQVSTNIANRTDDSDGIYHCYVNGRPQIGLNTSGQIQILYSSDSNSLTGYDNFAIIATRTGANSWSRTQAFNIDNLPQVSHDKEFEMLTRPTATNHLAWIDISNYQPNFMHNNGAWSYTTIAGYSGSFDNKHAQIDIDDNGTTHYFWFRDATGDVAFYHTTLSGSSYGTIDRIDVSKTVTGNLAPATIDPVTGKMYFLYLEGAFSVSGIFLIEYDPANQTSQEYELTNVGVPYGKRSLNVHNGFISYVGGSSGSTLFVTHLDAANLGSTNTAPVISGTPSSSVSIGQYYNFTPTASDDDGDNLTYSGQNIPAWANFNTATGNLSGTPQAGDEGNYSGISLAVSDGIDTVSLPTFSITVNAISTNVPTISGTPNIAVTIGESYNFTPTAFDADGDSLEFTITNLPAWASFDISTGTLSGTPQPGDEGLYGNIRISVFDGTSTVSLPQFSINVNSANINSNTAPSISGSPANTIEVGTSYSFTPTSSDVDADTLSFAVTNLPTWASFDTTDGSISGTPSRGDVGVYDNIQITVSDGSDTTTLAAFSITVTAPANPDAGDPQTPDNTTPDATSTGSDGGGSLSPYWLLLLLSYRLRRRQ